MFKIHAFVLFYCCLMSTDGVTAEGVPVIKRHTGSHPLPARAWSPTLPPWTCVWGIHCQVYEVPSKMSSLSSVWGTLPNVEPVKWTRYTLKCLACQVYEVPSQMSSLSSEWGTLPNVEPVKCLRYPPKCRACQVYEVPSQMSSLSSVLGTLPNVKPVKCTRYACIMSSLSSVRGTLPNVEPVKCMRYPLKCLAWSVLIQMDHMQQIICW